MIELQTHTQRKNEKWASFGEDLRLLADKAYPDLQAGASCLEPVPCSS